MSTPAPTTPAASSTTETATRYSHSQRAAVIRELWDKTNGAQYSLANRPLYLKAAENAGWKIEQVQQGIRDLRKKERKKSMVQRQQQVFPAVVGEKKPVLVAASTHRASVASSSAASGQEVDEERTAALLAAQLGHGSEVERRSEVGKKADRAMVFLRTATDCLEELEMGDLPDERIEEYAHSVVDIVARLAKIGAKCTRTVVDLERKGRS